MKKLTALVLVALLMVATLFGCGGDATTPGSAGSASGGASAAGGGGAPSGKNVLTVGIKIDLATLDIGSDGGGGASWNVNWLLYDHLVRSENDGSYTPRLWKEWSYSNEGKDWAITLREGVRFHNGEPFTSESMKVTLERIAQDATLKNHATWATLTEVEIIDDLNFVLHFSEPNGSVLANASGTSYVEPKAFAELGAEEYFLHPIGCGMYEFVSWTPGNEFIVERNPEFDYWDKEATTNIDRYVFKIITEDLTRVSALSTGEVDLIDKIPSEQFAAVEGMSGVTLEQLPGTKMFWAGFECGDGYIFEDAKVREAASLSIDRELIASSIYGNATAADWFTPKGTNAYDSENAGKYYNYDPEKAKQVLAESSYDGTPIRLIMVTETHKATELTQALISMMEAVGFKVNLEMVEDAGLMDKRNTGAYDMFVSNYSYVQDANMFCFYQLANDRSHTEFDNPEFKQFFIDSNAALDPEKRAEFLKAGLNMAGELHGPIIPLFVIDQVFGYVDGLTDFTTITDGMYDFRNLKIYR